MCQSEENPKKESLATLSRPSSMRQHLFPIREVHIPHGVLFVYRKVIYFIALIQQGLSYKTKNTAFTVKDGVQITNGCSIY